MNSQTSTLQSRESGTQLSQIWETLPHKQTIARTLDALKARSIDAELVSTSQEALDRLTKLIPEDTELMMGASKTLEEIGFITMLKTGSHKWRN